MTVRLCNEIAIELAGKHPGMNTNLLLAKSANPKERSVARIISIQFMAEKKIKENVKTSTQAQTVLFYTKPIFRARKYELF